MSDELPAAAADPPAAGGSGRAPLWGLIATLLVAFAIAAGVRIFVVEPFRIPSGSMLPTLLVGDHLFVNKFVYGARVPGLGWRLPSLREPRRGEVVVFRVAAEAARAADRRHEAEHEEFVKRIVGIPGDRIDIFDGVVFVNGEPVEVRRIDGAFPDELGRELVVEEIVLDGRRFRILDDPRVRSPDGTFHVEEGRYFMLGDNRDYSKDSRVWGSVARDELIGPAFLLYWSWDFRGGWSDLLHPGAWWDAQVRWERVGRAVE